MTRGLRVFGHPLHVMLTDFPVVLWSVSLAADAVWFWRGDQLWAQMAFWCLAAGLAAALPTVVTGLIDYFAIQDKPSATFLATRHMTMMAGAASAFTISLLVRGGAVPVSTGRFAAAVGCSAAGLVLLIFGAWMGGELVLHHGIGCTADDNGNHRHYP